MTSKKKNIDEIEDADELFDLGNEYRENGEYDLAIKCYRKTVELKPNLHVAWDNMGIAYYDKEEFDQAIECYKKAIELYPENIPSWQQLRVMILSDIMSWAINCYRIISILIGKIDSENEIIQRLPFEMQPNFLEIPTKLILIEELDHDMIETLHHSLEDAKLSSEEMDLLKSKIDTGKVNNLSTIERMKLIIFLMLTLNQITQIIRKVETWNEMGLAFYKMDEFDQAIECYKNAIELHPENNFARKNLDLIKKKIKLFEEIDTNQDKLKSIETRLTKIEEKHKEILKSGEPISEQELQVKNKTLEEKEIVKIAIEKKDKEMIRSEKKLQQIAKLIINSLQSDITIAILGQTTFKEKSRISRNIKKIDADYIDDILENLICSYPLQKRLEKQIEHISTSDIKNEIRELKRVIMNKSEELLDETIDRTEYSVKLKEWLWKAANEINNISVLRVFCTLFTNVLELPPVPIRILYLAANPRDERILDPQEEIHKIELELKSITLQKRCDFQPKLAVRAEELSMHLDEYNPDIVHFSGHGTTEGLKALDESRKSLIIPKDDLVGLFRLFKGKVRCVVLNACSSEELATALAEHIDCVVGMSSDIKDSAAKFFAQGFYRFLARGKNIQEAVDSGRAQIGAMTKTDKEIPRLFVAQGINPEEIVFIEN